MFSQIRYINSHKFWPNRINFFEFVDWNLSKPDPWRILIFSNFGKQQEFSSLEEWRELCHECGIPKFYSNNIRCLRFWEGWFIADIEKIHFAHPTLKTTTSFNYSLKQTALFWIPLFHWSTIFLNIFFGRLLRWLIPFLSSGADSFPQFTLWLTPQVANSSLWLKNTIFIEFVSDCGGFHLFTGESSFSP